MKDRVNPIRRAAVWSLACLFWAHALTVDRFALLSQVHWPEFAVKHRFEILLVSIIFFYSLLAEYSWISLARDIASEYLLPLEIIRRLAWSGAKTGYRWVRSKSTLIRKSEPTQVEISKSPEVEVTPWHYSKVSRWLFRPFRQFCLLWGLLILCTTFKPLIVAGCLVVFFAAIRSGVELSLFLAGSFQEWFDKLRSNFTEQTREHLKKLKVNEPDILNKELKKSLDALKFIHRLSSFCVNDGRLRRLAVGVSLSIALPYYLYITFLCSTGYVGLAHLLGMTWLWKEAFVESLFMPIAWSNLPHSSLIQLLAGLQATGMIYLGFGAVLRSFNQKAEQFSKTAHDLRTMLDDAEVRARLVTFEKTYSSSA